MTRLLLPFTFDVEMDILEALVLLASHRHATLVPLSLISLPSTKRKGARLELMQQSKDFLEAVRHKAARHHVPLEPVEVYTRDAAQSILLAVSQLHCDGILLAARGTRGSLVRMETIAHLLEVKPCSLFVVSFPPQKRDLWRARVRERFANVWPWSRSIGEPERREQAGLVPFPCNEQETQEPVALSHDASALREYQLRV